MFFYFFLFTAPVPTRKVYWTDPCLAQKQLGRGQSAGLGSVFGSVFGESCRSGDRADRESIPIPVVRPDTEDGRRGWWTRATAGVRDWVGRTHRPLLGPPHALRTLTTPGVKRVDLYPCQRHR